MFELTASPPVPIETPSPLEAIAEAYALGDAPSGELLFSQALDDGLPWDHVCAAAAQGIAQRYSGQARD